MTMRRVLCVAAATAVSSLSASRSPVSMTVSPPASVGRRGALGFAAAGFALGVVGAPESAVAYDVNKLNKKLDQLGLPPVASIPNGFNPVLSSVNLDQSLYVQFNHPGAWLVVNPSLNSNGESGTVSAGDYGKGDRAALFVMDLAPGTDKKYFETLIKKGVTQRGDNQIQGFKIKKIAPPVNGYTIVDFEYELLTGAGFIVERKGVASCATVGGKSQALLSVTTSARFKKLESDLRTIASSFRVYEKVRTAPTGGLLDD